MPQQDPVKRAEHRKAYAAERRDEIRARNKRWAEKNREAVAAKRQAYYQAHKDEYKKKNHERYLARREERIARQREYYRKHRAEILAQERGARRDNPEKYRERNKVAYQRRREKAIADASAYLVRVKELVRNYFGNRCACCGETQKEFLSLDHVFEDGPSERAHGKAQRCYFLVYKLIRERKPTTRYQLLCMNCNVSKHRGKGVCIHKRRQLNLVEGV